MTIDWITEHYIIYNLYYNITMQQVTSSTSNLAIRNAKKNLKAGPLWVGPFQLKHLQHG